MNVVVWVLTIVLAGVLLLAGAMKLAKSKPELVESGQGWAADFPAGVLKMIGGLEVLAAVGLVLPAVFDVATWLVPAAAIGVVLIMIGAAITHLRRHELPNVVVNLVLLALAAFIAIERIGPQSF